MAKCDECGRMENMPYRCRRCGGTFCADHRLPENHDCSGLDDWNDPNGVFDSGFDDSVDNRGGSASLGKKVRRRAKSATGTGGPGGYVRGNMTYVFLGAMWVWFFVELFVVPNLFGISVGSQLWYDIFTLNTTHPLYVWTWITAIFSHGGFGHIFVNSIVLYFFGPVVERRIGSMKFTALFLISGALAGLAQTWAVILLNPSVLGIAPPVSSVLGASGAIAALMGVLTVLNPNLRIYLYFIIPMPLWVATLLFAGYSVFVSAFGGIGSGGVAQLAHLAGLGVGLLYGAYLKRKGERAPQQLQFGGGPGGPGGPGRRGGGRF